MRAIIYNRTLAKIVWTPLICHWKYQKKCQRLLSTTVVSTLVNDLVNDKSQRRLSPTHINDSRRQRLLPKTDVNNKGWNLELLSTTRLNDFVNDKSQHFYSIVNDKNGFSGQDRTGQDRRGQDIDIATVKGRHSTLIAHQPTHVTSSFEFHDTSK